MSLERVRVIDEGLRPDWDARMRAHTQRVAGHDDERIDTEHHTATWLRVGMLMLEAPAELVGSFFPDLGLFRWWWSAKEPTIAFTPARMDEAFAEAQRTDLRDLLTRQVQLDDPSEAEMLCRVAACYARATALVQRTEADRVSWYAVFAAAARPAFAPEDIGKRESYLEAVRTLPPPAVAPKAEPAVPAATPLLLPPGRALLLPLAHATGTLLRRMYHTHVHAALLVVNVDLARDKARFYVTLVASLDDGELVAVDTTRELLDAVGFLMVEDIRSGNGRWRKLVVRLNPEGEGIAVARCEVSA